MKRKIHRIILLCWVAVLLCGCEENNNKNNQEKVDSETRDVFAMDTYMTLTAYGKDAKTAIDEAVKEIERLDYMFSVGNEESEVSILNENGAEIISQETSYLFEKSNEIYDKTEGKFDITVYPLMVEWGFTNQKYKVPNQAKIDELLKYVGASKIEYNKSSKLICVPEGVKIDFGGIAKGYTSQRIVEIFKKYNLVGGVVSLGGNVQTCGLKPNGEKFRIGIEDPFGNQDYVGILDIKDKAVITSGGYERFFEKEGVKYHHILNPQTGYPAESGLASVTIINNDGTMADGLSTALFVMGKNDAIDYWKKYGKKDGFDMILVEDDGEISITTGIENSFSSEKKIKIIKE